MSGTQYVILGYAVGLGLLWGYALMLWVASMRAARVEREGEGR